MNGRLRRTHFLGVILAITACGQADQSTQVEPAPSLPTASSSPNPPSYAAEPSISLSGYWRVAGIDGTEFDEPVGIALKGDEAAIWWEPRCAGVARGYQITGRSITFKSLESPRAPDSPTAPVCAIGLPPRLNDVFAALDAATSVERTPANGIQIAGGSRSVTLFSQ